MNKHQPERDPAIEAMKAQLSEELKHEQEGKGFFIAAVKDGRGNGYPTIWHSIPLEWVGSEVLVVRLP